MLEDDVTPKAILSWIESTGEAADRDAIVEAAMFVPDATTREKNKESGEQYYRTKYGETDH